MKLLIPIIFGVTLLLGSVDTLQAQTPLEMIKGNSVSSCIKDRQCDDYCRKAFPWAVPVCQSKSDNYCGKKLPCTSPVRKFVADNYCAKKIPEVCKSPCQCNGQLGKACDGSCRTHQPPQRRVIAADRSPFTSPFSVGR